MNINRKTLIFILLLIATAEGQLLTGEGGCFNPNSTTVIEYGMFDIYNPNNSSTYYYKPVEYLYYPNHTRQPYQVYFHIEYMEYSIGGGCNYGTGVRYIIKQGSYFIY